MPLPAELRNTPQWLVSSPTDKAPRSPKTGGYADVRDPQLYVTFDVAQEYASRHGFDVGFALTTTDPYVVVDLDEPDSPEDVERAQKILSLFFNTYAELSRSQRGVHIWCRGSLPRGARRDNVEVYPHARYIICTGLTLEGHDKPINDQQDFLDILFNEIGGTTFSFDDQLVEEEAILDDQSVLEMAMNAENADKFTSLCRGEWQQEYQSQSEADYALMNMFCFYSRSNEQCKRLFRTTELGKRPKAWREDYLNRMIAKIRSEEPQVVDFSGLQLPTTNGNGHLDHSDVGDVAPVPVLDEGWRDRVAIKKETSFGTMPPPGNVSLRITQETPKTPPAPTPRPEKKSPVSYGVVGAVSYPPGFVGEIARFITETAVRPVREVGVAAALGLCAGVLGRQFNISGTGLNQYIIVLAKTGTGKEGGPEGIARLISAARNLAPVVDTFIGPGTFASGQGLIRALDEKPSFVSILGEFGLTLQDLSDSSATSTHRVMRRVLLDLYSKSGRTNQLHSSAYSDKEKNTRTLCAPAVTLLGDATPETFFAGLTHAHIADGLIPRFLVIEYLGDRPDKNEAPFAPPPDHLLRRFVDLVDTTLRMTVNQSWQEVVLSAEAKTVLDAFDIACDDHIREGAGEGMRQLWNRAHLKALRLAALLCAADRPHEPVVNAVEAQWAVNVVIADTARMSARFESGDVGEGAGKLMADIHRVTVDFFEKDAIVLEKMYKLKNVAAFQQKQSIPRIYLQRRTAGLSAFQKHRLGATKALDEMLESLCMNGEFQKIPIPQSTKLFGQGGNVYFVPAAVVPETESA